MKKFSLLPIAVLVLFFIVSTSTAQAMLYHAQDNDQPALVLSGFDHLKHSNENPNSENNFPADVMKGNCGPMLARGGGAGGGGAGGGGGGGGAGIGAGAGIGGGKSNSSGYGRQTNQNVQRRGHGRSEMGDEYEADKYKNMPEKEPEWPEGEYPKGEYPKGEWGDAEYPED